MKPTLKFSASALFLVLALTTAGTSAASDFSWRFGTGFRLGGVEFSLGFHQQSPDNFYWRTQVDLGRTYYGREHRWSGCNVRDGYHYHGRSCPLIRSFFSHHGHDADVVFATYSPSRRHADPRYDGYSRYDQNDGYGRYDQDDGYHRYDQNDGYHRYDQNDGYHRYDQNDGYDRYDQNDRYSGSRRYRHDDWRDRNYRSRRGSSCPNR